MPKPNAFFKFVKHPGTKKQPFLGPAVKLGKVVLKKEVRAAILSGRSLKEIEANLALAVKKTAFFILRSAQQKVPVDTGRLRASLNAKRKDKFNWVVGTNVAYARFVEEGTKPHIIRPKDPNGFLAFFWPKLGGQRKATRLALAQANKNKKKRRPIAQKKRDSRGRFVARKRRTKK